MKRLLITVLATVALAGCGSVAVQGGATNPPKNSTAVSSAVPSAVPATPTPAATIFTVTSSGTVPDNSACYVSTSPSAAYCTPYSQTVAPPLDFTVPSQITLATCGAWYQSIAGQNGSVVDGWTRLC
jgi:hypothetical protein